MNDFTKRLLDEIDRFVSNYSESMTDIKVGSCAVIKMSKDIVDEKDRILAIETIESAHRSSAHEIEMTMDTLKSQIKRMDFSLCEAARQIESARKCL